MATKTRLLVSSKAPRSALVLRLARQLDVNEPAALGYLIFFLWWVIDNAPDGDVTDMDELSLANYLNWHENAHQLAQAFITAEVITRADDGRLHVFDWNDWQAGLYKVHGARLTSTEWQALRSRVFERDGYLCAYCGKPTTNPHCDHVIPVSRGGTNDADNLVTACARCNLSKGNKRLGEWR